MEVINIEGYFLDEKLQIARKHLIPELEKSCGIDSVFHIEIFIDYCFTLFYD